MRLAVLQHTEAEGPGSIAAWAGQRGVRLRLYPLHSGVEAPTLGAFDLLAIMGGPMSVHDAGSLPWMPAEKMLIRQALAAGKPLLGICLGAQLLAEALGASVSAGTAEIGWWPIQRHPRALRSPLAAGLPATLTPLHWHGETFSLPNDAIIFTARRHAPTRASSGASAPSGCNAIWRPRRRHWRGCSTLSPTTCSCPARCRMPRSSAPALSIAAICSRYCSTRSIIWPVRRRPKRGKATAAPAPPGIRSVLPAFSPPR
jgi:GMP synthase-like glutamine amidotransferase